MRCKQKNPEGECPYPYYGLAPHKHDLSITGSFVGSTVFTGDIPDNFEPDPDCEDNTHGVYHCPYNCKYCKEG